MGCYAQSCLNLSLSFTFATLMQLWETWTWSCSRFVEFLFIVFKWKNRVSNMTWNQTITKLIQMFFIITLFQTRILSSTIADWRRHRQNRVEIPNFFRIFCWAPGAVENHFFGPHSGWEIVGGYPRGHLSFVRIFVSIQNFDHRPLGNLVNIWGPLRMGNCWGGTQGVI